MDRKKKIFWIDLNRFDLKTDKSTWLEMAEALQSQGYDVEILTGYGKEKYYPKGGKANIRYFRAIKIGTLYRFSLLLNILTWILLNTHSRDIYILSPSALLIAPFLRLFFRSNIHLDIRSPHVDIHSWKDKLDYWIFWSLSMKLCGRLPRGYSFITERLRLAVEKEFKLGCKHYVIWQSGVNTQLFEPPTACHNQSKDFVLYYHGTISENRGVSRVVQALARLSGHYREHVRFIVIGSGSGYAKLRDLAAEEGLMNRIVLKGFLPYEQVPTEIAHADCCISPLPDCPEWNMSSPLKIFEYMASGKPMILTPIPAHQDVVQDGSFAVWTAGDSVEDFVRAIEYAYDNREKISHAAKEAAVFAREHYDWRSQGEKLAAYLRTTFENRNE